MQHYYGEEWTSQLALQSSQPAEPASASVAQPSAPRADPAPATGAVSAELPPGTPPRVVRALPGAGAAGASPGSGANSPLPSWHSASPGTPQTLSRRVLAGYDPYKETLEAYLNKVERQAQALEVLGEPLPDGVLAVLKAKAEYEARLHSETVAGADAVRMLKREFALEYMGLDGSQSQQVQLSALEGLLIERGVDVEELKARLTLGVADSPERRNPPPRGNEGEGPTAPPETFAMTPGAGSEVAEDLRRRIEQAELELAARRVGRDLDGANSPAIAEVLTRQSELLAKIVDRGERPKTSTIRVEPKIHWPHLGDDGPGGREVEDFYDRFEEICGLANNGQGMSDKEMVITLKSCLHGSRRKIYDNILKQHRATNAMETDEGPALIYLEVKGRHMKFLETSTERQLRVRGEWNMLTKGRRNALQFEAEWEQVTHEMEDVGLGLSSLEKFLSYLVKVGSEYSQAIRMDRRPRPDGAGGLTTRVAQTWEEAHEILCEIEGVKAGTRALGKAAGQVHDAGFVKGDGKRRKGKGKGTGEEKAPVCFEYQRKGTCWRGNDCRYSHDQGEGHRAKGAPQDGHQDYRKGAGKHSKSKGDDGKKGKGKEVESNAARPKAKAKGKGKGKGQASEGNDKKRVLCKYYKRPDLGRCQDGKDCPYSHNKRLFDPKPLSTLGSKQGQPQQVLEAKVPRPQKMIGPNQ